VPSFGGGGNPQRIVSIIRSPSRPTRITGANWSGKIAGSDGRFPARSALTRNNCRIASWVRVIE
jgi:hypothetical protein